MDVEMVGDALVDPGQELAEFHGAVPAMQDGNDLAGGGVERRVQGGDAVADVVVSPPFEHARHHRQYRPGAVQGLDLAFLVDTQHDRGLGWVEVQTDDVDDLVHEQRVVGQFERAATVRFQVEAAPDPADRGLRQAAAFGHRRPGPVGGVAGCRFEGGHDTSSIRSTLIDGGRPGRGSSTRPSKRSVSNRDRHLPTVGRDTPSRYATSTFDKPPAGKHDPAPQRQCLRTLGALRPPRQRDPFLVARHQGCLRPTTSRHGTTPPIQTTTFRRRTLGRP
jgi:hypothetical protein